MLREGYACSSVARDGVARVEEVGRTAAEPDRVRPVRLRVAHRRPPPHRPRCASPIASHLCNDAFILAALRVSRRSSMIVGTETSHVWRQCIVANTGAAGASRARASTFGSQQVAVVLQVQALSKSRGWRPWPSLRTSTNWMSGNGDPAAFSERCAIRKRLSTARILTGWCPTHLAPIGLTCHVFVSTSAATGLDTGPAAGGRRRLLVSSKSLCTSSEPRASHGRSCRSTTACQSASGGSVGGHWALIRGRQPVKTPVPVFTPTDGRGRRR